MSPKWHWHLIGFFFTETIGNVLFSLTLFFCSFFFSFNQMPFLFFVWCTWNKRKDDPLSSNDLVMKIVQITILLSFWFSILFSCASWRSWYSNEIKIIFGVCCEQIICGKPVCINQPWQYWSQSCLICSWESFCFLLSFPSHHHQNPHGLQITIWLSLSVCVHYSSLFFSMTNSWVDLVLFE